MHPPWISGCIGNPTDSAHGILQHPSLHQRHFVRICRKPSSLDKGINTAIHAESFEDCPYVCSYLSLPSSPPATSKLQILSPDPTPRSPQSFQIDSRFQAVHNRTSHLRRLYPSTNTRQYHAAFGFFASMPRRGSEASRQSIYPSARNESRGGISLGYSCQQTLQTRNHFTLQKYSLQFIPGIEEDNNKPFFSEAARDNDIVSLSCNKAESAFFVSVSSLPGIVRRDSTVSSRQSCRLVLQRLLQRGTKTKDKDIVGLSAAKIHRSGLLLPIYIVTELAWCFRSTSVN